MPTLDPEERILAEAGYFLEEIYEDVRNDVLDETAEYEHTSQMALGTLVAGTCTTIIGVAGIAIENWQEVGVAVACTGLSGFIIGAYMWGINEFRHGYRRLSAGE